MTGAAPGASLRALTLQMVGVSVLHTLVLLLLMVRVEHPKANARLDQPARR